MYIVYADEHIIYHPELVDHGLAIYNPTVTLEANKSGSFQFTMPVTNTYYNSLQKMKTIITVFQNGTEIFRGRVLNDEKDFYNNKVVYCEGELAFLLDSIVRPYDYDGTIAGFFGYLVANHNTEVESEKQFTVGTVTVLPDTEFKLSITDYVSTWYVFNTYLLDVYGGYIRIRLDNGVRYLDYISSYANTNTQVVAFGENMLDISQYISAESVFTNLIPLGSTYTVELEDSEITPGQISKIYTEAISNLNGDATPFIFSLEVILNSKSKANETSNITVNYGVKTKDSSTVTWSGLSSDSIYADIQLTPDLPNTSPVTQKSGKASATINGTEQILVTWTGNVKTQNIVITGEFINRYVKSSASAGAKARPISNSMATVCQLLQQKYLKTTIATVNNNSDVLTDSAAVDLFGNILAVHTWDDVDDPAELKTLGEQYLADNIEMAVKLNVNAVDLNLLNVNYEKFKIGDRIRVVSAPHSLDSYFTCTRITLDLQHPDNNTYSLGSEFKTLTETQITAAKDIQVTNEMISQLDNSLDAVKSLTEQLNDLINTIYDKYADVTTVINNLDTAYADIDFANITTAAIANLTADQAFINALDAAYANITLANIDVANIDTANVDAIVAGAVESGSLTTTQLAAVYATISELHSDYITANNIVATYATLSELHTDYIDAATIDTNYAEIDLANITRAAINTLTAGNGTFAGLNATYADVGFTNIGTAAVTKMLGGTGVFDNLTVNQDLTIAGRLNTRLIAAGTIIAEKLLLRGDDGLYYQLNITKKDELKEGKTPAEQAAIEAEWALIPEDDLESCLHGENIIADTITAKQIAAGSITAQELAVLDASQVTFQYTPSGGSSTTETMGSFITDVNGLNSSVTTIQTTTLPAIQNTLDGSVASYTYRYYKSTSATTQPSDSDFDGASGSDTMPAREDGKYIWRRTTQTKNDGTPSKIYEMIQGADGDGVTLVEPIYYQQKVSLDISLNGNSLQAGEPSLSSPVTIQNVSGNNTVTIKGKNLLSDDTYKTGNYLYIGATGTGYRQKLPAGTYTISDSPNISVGTYYRGRNDSDNTCLIAGHSTPQSKTFNLVDGDYRFYFYKSGGVSKTDINYYQLEKGSIATSYAPYVRQSYPVNLGTIVLSKIGEYQDYLYKSNDKWYVHKELASVDLGTLTWRYYSTSPTFMYNSSLAVVSGTSDVLCSAFICADSSSATEYLRFNGQILRIYGTSYTDPARFKTAVNGVMLYYPLATATDTEITDTTLIEQLEAISSVVSYDGGTNIFQTNADLPFDLVYDTTATVTPLRPVAEVTIKSNDPEVWSLEPAPYREGYRYYQSQQTHLDNNTVVWSGVVASDELNDVHERVTTTNTTISNMQGQIILKANQSTVDSYRQELNNNIVALSNRVSNAESNISINSEQIASAVTESVVNQKIDAATGQLVSDVEILKRTSLTQDSSAITRMVASIDNLQQQAESSALKVKSDGTYIYKGVANAQTGEVTLDEQNYTKVDTVGQHTYANGQEVAWNTSNGVGGPKVSLGQTSTDEKRWVFSMDGDLLNIRWIDNT